MLAIMIDGCFWNGEISKGSRQQRLMTVSCREYEYVMQAAYAYARQAIDFEAWTDFSAGLREFFGKYPMPDAKFEEVLRLHFRFARVRNEVSRGSEGTFLVLPPA